MKFCLRLGALLCALASPAMAQLQIQQLPPAATPLNCEYVPVQQLGTTSAAKVCDFGIPVQGTSAPATDLLTGREWLNTSTTPPTLEIYDGTQWVGTAQINPSTHSWTPLYSLGSPALVNGSQPPEFRIHTISAVQSTATGTGEQVLDSYSLPAGSLDIAGRNIRITAWFAHTGANSHSVTDKLYFGSESIGDGGVSTANAVTRLEMEVLKVGSNQQSVIAGGTANGAVVAAAYTAATETDTSAIVIQASCTDGTSHAGDGNLVAEMVEFIN